jgi:hypothetical protein
MNVEFIGFCYGDFQHSVSQGPAELHILSLFSATASDACKIGEQRPICQILVVLIVCKIYVTIVFFILIRIHSII